MKHRLRNKRGARLHGAALLAPFERVADAPTWAKLSAVLGAAGHYLLYAPFAHAMYLLVAMSLFDYFYGAQVARLRPGDHPDRYDPDKARAGALGKGAGLIEAIVLRLLEGLLASAAERLGFGVVDTNGAIAFGFVCVLLLAEIESFDGHKRELTGKPTPFIGPLLDFLRSTLPRK